MRRAPIIRRSSVVADLVNMTGLRRVHRDPPKPAVVDEGHPRFARFTEHGKVHVLRTRNWTFGDSDVAAFLGSQWALCGKTGRPGEQYGISHFPDDDLCVRCHDLWPYDPIKLFEHEESA